MKLIGQNLINAFKAKHATCRKALDRIVQIIQSADWEDTADVKSTLGANVDFVGRQTVIDAGGNKVRLITKITFLLKLVQVTHVLDHKEYDKGNWKE